MRSLLTNTVLPNPDGPATKILDGVLKYIFFSLFRSVGLGTGPYWLYRFQGILIVGKRLTKLYTITWWTCFPPLASTASSVPVSVRGNPYVFISSFQIAGFLPKVLRYTCPQTFRTFFFQAVGSCHWHVTHCLGSRETIRTPCHPLSIYL